MRDTGKSLLDKKGKKPTEGYPMLGRLSLNFGVAESAGTTAPQHDRPKQWKLRNRRKWTFAMSGSNARAVGRRAHSKAGSFQKYDRLA